MGSRAALIMTSTYTAARPPGFPHRYHSDGEVKARLTIVGKPLPMIRRSRNRFIENSCANSISYSANADRVTLAAYARLRAQNRFPRGVRSGAGCLRIVSQALQKQEALVCTRASRRRGRLPGIRPNRSCSHVVGTLSVIGEVEAFAFDIRFRTQSDDHVDDFIENRRTNTGPHQRG